MNIMSNFQSAGSILLCGHLACLLAAPYSSYYHRLKKLALWLGVFALPAIVSRAPHITITIRLIILAFVFAYVALFCALSFANFSMIQGFHNFRKAFSFRIFKVPPAMLILILFGALFEECIWRVGVQTALGNGTAAMIATALLFHLCHLVRSRKLRIPKMLDIWCFSLVNGFVFSATSSLFAVVVIHAVRNIHLFRLRYEHEPKYHNAIDASQNMVRAIFRHGIALMAARFRGSERFMEHQPK